MSKEVTTYKPGSTAVSIGSELSDAAKRYAKLSMPANTKRAYAAQWRLWTEWAEHEGVEAIPADPVDAANWIAARAEAGQKVSTMRTAIAAIRTANISAGVPFDSQHPAIVTVLKGIKRDKAGDVKQVAPLGGVHVAEIIAECGETLIGHRDAALVALGYMAALRRSELVALDWETLGKGDGVVRVTAREIEITLVRSKTNKGDDTETVIIPRHPNRTAIDAIMRWIDAAAIHPGEPIMRNVGKGGNVGGRLHPQSVAKIVKVRVTKHFRSRGLTKSEAEAEAGRFSAHSLRVGFATTAAESGADLGAIASVTRHKSLDMPRHYAKRADLRKLSPYNHAGVGLDRSEG